MSRMWPSVRSCVDVSACRCRGHMKPELRTSTAYQRELRCSSALFRSALALGTCQRKLAGWLAVDGNALPHCFTMAGKVFQKRSA
jgi:hypothetical protein